VVGVVMLLAVGIVHVVHDGPTRSSGELSNAGVVRDLIGCSTGESGDITRLSGTVDDELPRTVGRVRDPCPDEAATLLILEHVCSERPREVTISVRHDGQLRKGRSVRKKVLRE